MPVSIITAAPVPSGIKSIQRGVITMSAINVNAAIAAVNTAKAELRFLGVDNAPGVRLILSNATTVSATTASINTPAAVVAWELTEWY